METEAEQTLFNEPARAKINLTLHVASADGRGYHPLNSLVVFADIGDDLTARPAQDWGLKAAGPFAADLPPHADNLVMRSAKRIALSQGVQTKLHFTLHKNLPIASGIGGGSANAAAAIRVLARINGAALADFDYLLVEEGADVPVCFQSCTALMQGIGERVIALPGLGQIHAVLINPGVPVSTGAIFKAFDSGEVIAPPAPQPDYDLLSIARAGRNDLQPYAIALCPDIQTVLDAINATSGCQLARMSGSGATCFGLYDSAKAARAAQAKIAATYPNWWCVSTVLGDQALEGGS